MFCISPVLASHILFMAVFYRIRSSIWIDAFWRLIFRISISYLKSIILFLSISPLTLEIVKWLLLLFFWSFLFINEQTILILKTGNKIIESEIVSFELSQFINLFFKLIDQNVLLIIFNLWILMNPNCCIRIVEIFAVHFVTNSM